MIVRIRHLLLWLWLPLAALPSTSDACSPWSNMTVNWEVVGTELRINLTSHTAYQCCYTARIEVRCASQNFTGNQTHSSNQVCKGSGTGAFSSWNTPEPYNLVTVDLSQYCPGTALKWRAREQGPDGFGPYTATYNFTVPGTPGALSANVVANPTGVCPGGCTTLTASSTGSCGSETYSWSSGGNGTTTTVCPTQTSTYTVTVTDPGDACGGGGTATANVTVSMDPPPVAGTASVAPASVCPGQSTTLTLTGHTGDIQWQGSPTGAAPWTDIPGATGTTLTIPDVTASASFRAVVSNACESVQSNVVTVNLLPLPAVNFSFVEACVGVATQFTDLTPAGTAASWSWDFGVAGGSSASQSPVFTYDQLGQYDVTLEVVGTNGCVNSVTQQVGTYASPTAGFTATTVCVGQAMNFTDTSTDNVGTVNTWAWDFDGLGQSAVQNPQFTFAAAGTFTVELTVTSSLNCSDNFQADVTVLSGPVADFTWNDVCLGSSTSFTDASTVSGGGAIASWQWDLGDTGSATDQNPVHTYGTSGQFDVTLTVESASGCSNAVTQQVNVYDLPTAAFTADDVCEGGVVVFTNTSTAAGSYQWDLGDNTEVTDQVPAPHTYAMHGTFNIELIVFSGLGCSDTVTGTVSVFPAPTANFTFDTVCFPSPTTFTDLSAVGGNGVITGWDWKFGDENIDLVNQNPVHTYAQWGDYEVTLTVTTADGCSDEVVIGPARVHPRPLAMFRNNIANCLGETTSFSDMSAIENTPDDFINSWGWNFGDGGFSTEAEPDHDYQADGIFPVTLTVVSNHGCESSVTHNVEIYPLPSVDFSVDTTAGCQPFGVQFFDQTSLPAPYNIASWEWDFGDGSGTSGSQFPGHTFNDPDLLPNAIGQFDVMLTVTSGNGCVSSLTKTNYISCHPKPTAYFHVSPPEADLTFAKFTVTDAASPDVIEWLYTTGDWGSYSMPSFQHTYTDTGLFTLTQIVSTAFGCKDTIEATVRVNPEFFFYIPNTFTPNNDGDNDTFFGTGVGVVDYRMIIFDRWGAQVFESGSMDLHWDGTKNGRQVQVGVYTYMFTVVDIKGAPHHYVGHVNLMR